MTVSEEQSGSQTAVISTEHTLAETGGANDLPAGYTYALAVDCSDLASGDTVVLRLYTKVRSGDTAALYDLLTLDDAQSEPAVQSVPLLAPHYAKATLEQTAGTGRAFSWAVYRL